MTKSVQTVLGVVFTAVITLGIMPSGMAEKLVAIYWPQLSLGAGVVAFVGLVFVGLNRMSEKNKPTKQQRRMEAFDRATRRQK